jgi:hypothetical protein
MLKDEKSENAGVVCATKTFELLFPGEKSSKAKNVLSYGDRGRNVQY